MDTNKKLQKIIKVIKSTSVEIRRKYKAEIVGIFGSYVRGEQKKKSDLDILVKFYNGATLIDFNWTWYFLRRGAWR